MNLTPEKAEHARRMLAHAEKVHSMNAAVTETLPAVAEPAQQLVAASPLDMPAEAFSGALARRGQNRKALMEWIRSSLVVGVDYGRIHVVSKSKCDKGNACTNPYHFSKDCLFKPGAEKIAGMLGVTPTFPTLQKYEEAALNGIALKQIILRCHMVDGSGRIVADGIGGRSLEQDYGDLNKALKMCAKSAHIDATLRMAGLSEVFTQDLDQMKADGKFDGAGQDGGGPPPPPPPAPKNDGTDEVPCGKHKGKPWKDVVEDYLQWAVSAPKAPKDLKDAAQRELDRRDRARHDAIDNGEIPY